MPYIPEVIYKYNVYTQSAEQLLGTGEEFTLPDLQAMSSSMSGSGILGEIDSPMLGAFGSTEIEIPFRAIGEETFKFMREQSFGAGLTIRGSVQVTNPVTHEIDFVPIRVVVKGRNKGINLGKFKQGNPMDCSVKLEVTYLMVEVDGKTMLELDKFNSIYVVDGVDQLEKIRRMC